MNVDLDVDVDADVFVKMLPTITIKASVAPYAPDINPDLI
jgi:hypothetical protein